MMGQEENSDKRGSTSGARADYPLKRPLDICLSAIGLLVLSPLLAFVALLVLVTMGQPVFFVQ